MRRSHQTLLSSLLFLTLVGIAIIIWILLFNQKAVPQLTVQDGKDGVVDYAKVENYIDGKISSLPVPQNGRDAVVDYNLIDSIIAGKVAQIPPAQNGVNGTNGTNGADGKSCSATQLEDGAAITCEDGTSAVIKNGADGEDAYIELRCNTEKNRWEVRYTADGAWTVLNNKATKCTNGVIKE